MTTDDDFILQESDPKVHLDVNILERGAFKCPRMHAVTLLLNRFEV